MLNVVKHLTNLWDSVSPASQLKEELILVRSFPRFIIGVSPDESGDVCRIGGSLCKE